MERCILCKSSKKDDIQYGDFMKYKKRFGVHTYCLYLSSSLAQRGTDDQGVLGFLVGDIKAEVKRVSQLKCCYCSELSANIGCCKSKCRRNFHLICGLENKAENTFCRDFASYCHKHVRKTAARPSEGENCLICFDSLFAAGEKFNGIDVIMTPCCRNGWFHRVCLLKFAKTAGYFFKCPLCNDDKVFREKLPAKGIFIPNQDAAWELEPNAYAELLERPSLCAAQECKNSKGRSAKCESDPFVNCSTCGSIAVHKYCLSDVGSDFNCIDCAVVVEERDSGHESLNSQVKQNDDECIDVCLLSDTEGVVINSIMVDNESNSATEYGSRVGDQVELTVCTVKNGQQTKSNEEQNSGFETETDDIKPYALKTTARLRLDSASSETSQAAYSSSNKASFKTAVDDKETPRKKKKFRHTKSSKERQTFSDIDSDDVKPSASKQKTRLRLESENSEISEESNSSNNKTGFRTKKIQDFSEQVTARINENQLSSDSDNDDVKPSASKQKTRLRLESESSVTSQKIQDNNKTAKTELDSETECSCSGEIVNKYKLFKKRSTNFATDSEEELEQIQASHSNTKCSQNSDSSGHAEQSKSRRKRKRSHILNDSEDEIYPPKQTCLGDENIGIQRAINKIYGSDDDNDSDDPLEDFYKVFEKTNRLSKLTTTIAKDKHQSESGTEKKQSTSKKSKNLAQRRTVGSGSNIKAAEKKQKENLLDISCIALRTRRRTICGRTDFERLQGTNKNLGRLTNTENCSEQESTSGESVCSSLSSFMVDDGYTEHDSEFDISCIANRTRRRKSLKSKHLPNIVEISECSTDSYQTEETLFENNTSEGRRNLRLMSNSSSVECDKKPSKFRKNVAVKLEKFPVQDFTAVLKSNDIKKAESSKTKHAFNYHPHSSKSNGF